MKKKLLLEIVNSLKGDIRSKKEYHVNGKILKVEGESLLLLIIKKKENQFFIFQSNETFITYDISNHKWRTAQLEYLLGYNCSKKYFIDKRVEELVFNFLPNEKGDALGRVGKLQDNIRKVELKKKHDQIRVRIDEKMACIK